MSTGGDRQARGILAIWHGCADGREAEIDAWYQGEHLIERLGVPGFLYGRRHEALSASPRYFTTYVTESVDVLTSRAYLDRLDNPTPLTRTVMSEIFRDMHRTVCRRELRVGRFRGAFAVTARFDALPDMPAISALAGALVDDPGIACAELWRRCEPESGGPVAQEERLRGGDRRIEACLVVETLREEAAGAVLSDLAGRFPDAQTGIYRVLCGIGHSGA
jgi:hypothetical protein